MTQDNNTMDKDRFEVTDDESEKRKTVRCPDCGEESSVSTELAVIHDEIKCNHCGHAQQLNAPSPIWVLFIIFGALLYFHLVHRPKEWLMERFR